MTVFTTNIRPVDLITDATPGATLNIILNAVSVQVRPTDGFPHTISAINGKGDLIFPGYEDFIEYDDKGVAANRPPAGSPLVLTFNLQGDDGSLTGTAQDIDFTITGISGVTAPAAFVTGDWQLNDVPSVNGDKLEINILTLPSDGGSAITAIKYQVDSGAGFGAVQTLSGTGIGPRTITVLAGVASTVRMWAENAVGPGATNSKSQTPTVISGGEPAAHTTVANDSALGTLLSQLESNYDVTVAANGGTAGQEFYIDCLDGAYTYGTLSNRSFAHMVHVRAQDQAGGCTLPKGTLSASSNLRVAYFDILNGGGSGVTLQISGGCSDLTVSHCRVYGHPTYGSKASGSVSHGVDIRGDLGARMSNIRIEYCDIQRAGQNGIRGLRVDGLYFGHNTFDENGADDWQIKNIDGAVIENNWSTTLDRAGSSAHMDGGQMTKETSTGIGCFNITIRGNVVADWRITHPDDIPHRMGWQCGDFQHQNITITDNIVLTGNTHGCNIHGALYVVTNNLFWRLNGTTNIHGTTHTAINGSASGTFDDNFEMIPAGSGATPRPGSTNVDNTNAARATYIGDLRTGGDTWPIGGVGGDFSEMMPPVTSTLHWNHASKSGPWNRLKEVFVDGVHPGNDGWPTASHWNATHNQHGRITS